MLAIRHRLAHGYAASPSSNTFFVFRKKQFHGTFFVIFEEAGLERSLTKAATIRVLKRRSLCFVFCVVCGRDDINVTKKSPVLSRLSGA